MNEDYDPIKDLREALMLLACLLTDEDQGLDDLPGGAVAKNLANDAIHKSMEAK